MNSTSQTIVNYQFNNYTTTSIITHMKQEFKTYDQVKDVIVEYVSFVMNLMDDNTSADPANIEMNDRKRRMLHERIITAFGYSPSHYRAGKMFSTDVLEKLIKHHNGNVEQISLSLYAVIQDRIDNMELDISYPRARYVEKRKMEDNDEFSKLHMMKTELETYDKDFHTLYDKLLVLGEEKEKAGEIKSKYDLTGGFYHECNGLISRMKSYCEIVETFSKMPIYAYTDAAVVKYINEPFEKFITCRNRICFMLWKYSKKLNG